MQNRTLAAIAAASLLATPAFAQSSTTTSGKASSAATEPASGGSSASTTPSADSMQLRQKISSDLEKDGFKNIHVVADSFLVNAENKDGQKVVMIIDPDSVFSITQVGQNSGSATSRTDMAKK